MLKYPQNAPFQGVFKIVLDGHIARIRHSVLDQPILPPRPLFNSGKIVCLSNCSIESAKSFRDVI